MPRYYDYFTRRCPLILLPGIKYLMQERGITEESIRTFGLGYCDQYGFIYLDADFKGTLPQLDNRFKEASIFPIMDMYGRVLGVSARPLVQTPDTPKYINTVYEKASHLYGLNVSLSHCEQADKVYIVEGNVDTIMMYQAGIKNVVGMLGSNFSLTQLCLLSRIASHIVFVPDGDKAGMNFLSKMQANLSKKFNEVEMTYSMISLPIGYDPDKFLKTNTKDDLLALERGIALEM